MKTNNKRVIIINAVSCVFLLFSCFYMYDFYKCLSGFIANGFREPLVMLPMILAFFLPVFCFLFFFYDYFIGAINPIIKTVYSVFVILYAAADLVLIFMQSDLYVSNHALGVYDALPSIFLHFPYDMIIILSALILVQIFNLVAGNRKNTKTGELLNGIKRRGRFKISVFEYILLCVLAIIVFVFTGSGIFAAFSAIDNAFYDFRYIFLLVWVAVIPMANLAMLLFKPQKTSLSEKSKLFLLGTIIAANLVFGALFWVLEITYPDFLVHIGKPLFLIAFSISLPIEPCIILGIMALGTLVFSARAVITAVKKNSDNLL